MALALQDAFSTPGLSGWTATNMENPSGVMKPTAYGTDAIAIWGTVSSTADMRCKFTLGGSAIRSFGVFLRKADTVASTAADHYLFKFTVGGTSTLEAPPAWNNPDTITLSKTISTVATEKTPTNTENLLVPYVGNTVSLRDVRLVSGTTIMCACVDDKFLAFVDDDLMYYESFTGLDAVGYMGIIHYADATADTTFDDFYTSGLAPKYTSKYVSASNLNSGADATTNAFATIPKLWADLATDEIGFIGAGTYTEQLKGYSLDGYGLPRTPSSRDDGVYILNIPDEYVLIRSTIPLHAKDETKYTYFYGLEVQNSQETGVNHIVNFHAGGGVTGPLYCTFHNMIVRHAYQNGVLLVAGSDHEQSHRVIGCKLKGNGRNPSAHAHNLYQSGRDTVTRWCEFDGVSDHPTWTNLVTIGYGGHFFYSGSSNVGNNNITVQYNVAHGHLQTQSGGIILSHGTGMICEGNTAYNNHDGITLRYNPAMGIECRNNLSYENTNRGIYLNDSSANHVYNNTSVYNTAYGIYAGSGSANDTAKNNMLYGNTTNDITVHASATNFTDTSNWKTATADPLFIDVANDSYGLTDSSTAKTGGVDLYTADGVVVDIRGLLRPQSASMAYGAYEVPVPPESNPVVVMASTFSGLVGVAIPTLIQITDADGDARKAYLDITGDATISITAGSATVEGGS